MEWCKLVNIQLSKMLVLWKEMTVTTLDFWIWKSGYMRGGQPTFFFLRDFIYKIFFRHHFSPHTLFHPQPTPSPTTITELLFVFMSFFSWFFFSFLFNPPAPELSTCSLSMSLSPFNVIFSQLLVAALQSWLPSSWLSASLAVLHNLFCSSPN